MEESKVDVLEKKYAISEKLIDALTQHYQPALDYFNSDETKSTQELINEMADMEEIFPYEVNRLMEERGFKIHYDGSGYVWLLKKY